MSLASKEIRPRKQRKSVVQVCSTEHGKTLEEAIGCWTTNMDYNSVLPMALKITDTSRRCRHLTIRGNQQGLKTELVILRRQTESMIELTDAAIKRLEEIIRTEEVK